MVLLLDFCLHRLERLGIEVDLDLLAFLILAVDLVAVAVDLELVDEWKPSPRGTAAALPSFAPVRCQPPASFE